MKTKNTEQKIKNAILTGLAGIIGFLPMRAACQENQAEDKARNSSETKAKITGCVNSTAASGYIARAGFVISDKPTVQSLISANYGNLSGFVWNNTKPKELDIGLRYAIPGKKVSFRIGGDIWNYPGKSNILGDRPDKVLEAGIHYSGMVELDATVTHLFNNGLHTSGQMLHTTLTRPIKLTSEKGKNEGIQATLTPSLNAAYLNHYFGKTGLVHITPGLTLGVGKGSVSLEAFVKQQFGLKDTPNHTYGGIGIAVGF